MPADGHLVVVDRSGPDGEPRRLANHRRRIAPAVVREELREAGFRPVQEPGTAGPGRFLMVFAPDLAGTQPDAGVAHDDASAFTAPAPAAETNR